SVTGSSSQPYNLTVIKATPTPRGPYYTIGHLPGPMGPYTFTFNANAPHSEMHFARDEEKVSALHPAGFTVGANTTDCIVVFPEGSGLEPLYFSMTVILPEGPLKQRQEEENQARAKADAEAEAKAKAEAEAKAKAEREALFTRAGVVPAPTYTPEMVKSAEAALGAAGVMVLGQTPGAMQLSVAGGGVLTATGEVLSSLGAAVGRAIASLGATATAGTAGPMVAAASAILFPPAAGEGSDRVPGRDLNAMFALNAQLLAGQDVKIEPGATSVNLPERGHLVNSNGQMALQLLKTGDTLPAAVPVLNAVRDAATGLDRITVPAVAGAPERTILVNPAPPPAAPSDTASPPPSVPVTPVHTGTEIKPVETITVTTTPAADIGGLQDFIYWRPDAAGTGVEPVYVMLSGLYGETNAKGKYSGRDYNSDKAGGPIQDLDWKTATIDREGVDKVKLHTGRFGESAENVVMIDRLEKILKGELQPTDTDKRFYTHEIRELERYRAVGVLDGVSPDDDGVTWNNTHTATLEDYKLSSDRSLLYTPEALKAGDE
ncbi:S-type pyocin domain-containing protein, partial [Salmonella enterica]|nr:S-type pyocin domain-containing protein [Salmonella enterica]